MIHLLVVLPSGAEAEDLSGRRSSVEVLVAHGVDEAVDKIARNRRLDGVLLAGGAENAAIAAAIREDNLSPPPLFVSGEAEDLPGTRRLAAQGLPALLDLIAGQLQAE
jgi:NaMN:DMB phosphoribosyltransferase